MSILFSFKTNSIECSSVRFIYQISKPHNTTQTNKTKKTFCWPLLFFFYSFNCTVCACACVCRVCVCHIPVSEWSRPVPINKAICIALQLKIEILLLLSLSILHYDMFEDIAHMYLSLIEQIYTPVFVARAMAIFCCSPMDFSISIKEK